MTPRDFAEKALLGTLLTGPAQIRSLDWLQAEDFRSPAHQHLYRVLSEMVAEHDAAERDEDGEDFDFHRDVLGDDLVVGGVAYDSTVYELVDGEIVERSEQDKIAQHARRMREHHEVPGIDPVTVLQRLQADPDPSVQRNTTLTAPGLHDLIAAAPPIHAAQPEAYGQIVLEASIRRQVQAAGIRVGHAAETSSDLAGMLDVVEHALTEVDDARRRWDGLADTAPQTEAATRPERAARDPLLADGPRLDANAQHDAEYGLVAEVLADPFVLDELADRVQPRDFGDQELGNTFRAASAVHAQRFSTHTRVDAVTVAWEQQRQAPNHGDGLEIDELAELGHSIPLGRDHAHHCAEGVLRGSLERLTATASESVTAAAQHPGLQPSDVLHTSSSALEGVLHMARRAASPAAQLAQTAQPGHSPTTPRAPSSAQQPCAAIPLHKPRHRTAENGR
ncbi:DnaB-like helicase N-terminal domain-containing protein [Saccharopolyspora griseoalba]|uniref:DnaB-like helicase N-terminal domain-containing protein n=1 Tax=Saccharopolyspora griseoalba TaxID=1431848 RepID=A0ABW2LQU6_9PSEU